MSLSDIVQVNILRQTTAVSRVGFSTVNILGTHKRFTERIKYYSSINSVAEDFQTSDLEYVAANEAFAQDPVVTRVAISRRKTGDTVIITVSSVADNTIYTVTINGTAITYTSDADATNLEIADGLTTAINLLTGTTGVASTDNLDGTFNLDPSVAGTAYSLTVDSNLSTAALTTPDAIGDDLDAVVDSNSDWYGLVITSRVVNDVTAVAAWTESNKKLFGTSSSNADVVNTTDAADTTTIAALLKASAYARTFSMYHPDSTTRFPESAVFGEILTRDPGSYTTMFKTIAGISAVDMTDTQITNALAKNVLIYHTVGDVNILQEGKVAEGEYIDTIILVDWTKARIQEGVFGRFANLPKVPFIDSGIAIVEGEVKSVYDQGYANGGFKADPAPIITVPKASEVSSTNKNNRFLPDVKFTFYLAGAIHATKIDGVVTV